MDETVTTEAPQNDLTGYIESVNLAEKLDKEQLRTIGEEAKEGYELDVKSREDWEKASCQWIELAKLTVQNKSFPWPNASNVKYPLLATASMQFAARAYPSLIPSDGKIVKARIVGKDPDDSKTATAEAVSLYMSYQLMEEMSGWEEEMDRLLIMLPVIGTMFKKTHWDPIRKTNCSKTILPSNLVVDYWARSLQDAERISEVLEVNKRVMKEKQQSKIWIELEDNNKLGDPTSAEHDDKNIPPEIDETTPYVFIEQHTYLDLDKDGYKEPYIVTFHKTTGTVMRIVARFDESCIHYNDKGELTYIEAIQYYTKFGFVPNPDGSFYDIGFGILLGPINEAVNSIINQLIDSGTVNNLQSGFIGKGLRLRAGEQRFSPGEWKSVNSTGDDLKKQIVPLPSKEPSKTLFELLSLLIQSGKELASVAEIFTGKMPGQNTPATTTMATVEQGMKVFTAVYKRIYRSLSEEFKKLYRLNGIYINPNTIVDTMDMPIGPEDFKSDSHRIIPGADPIAVSQTEKVQKAQGLMEMLMAGMPLDPVKVVMRMLQAQEQPNWQELILKQVLQTGQMPPQPPDPKIQALQIKAEADQQASQQDMANKQHQSELDARGKEFELQTKEQEAQIKQTSMKQEAQLKLRAQLATDHVKIATAQQQHQQTMQQNNQAHSQSMQHAQEASTVKVAAMKQQAKVKPSNQGAKK